MDRAALVFYILFDHSFVVHLLLKDNLLFVECVQPSVRVILEVFPNHRLDVGLAGAVHASHRVFSCGRLSELNDYVFVLDNEISGQSHVRGPDREALRTCF